MHKPVQAETIVCDTCKQTFKNINGDWLFEDEDTALDESAKGGWWCDGYGHHYCKKDTKAAKKEAKAAGVYSD